jgi:hypothetical protein
MPKSYKKKRGGNFPKKDTNNNENAVMEISDLNVEEELPTMGDLQNRLNRLRMEDGPSTPLGTPPRRDEMPDMYESDEEIEEFQAPGAPRRNRRRGTVRPIEDEEDESRRVLFPDFDSEDENEEVILDDEETIPSLPQQGGRKRKTSKRKSNKKKVSKKKRTSKKRKSTRKRKNTRKH